MEMQSHQYNTTRAKQLLALARTGESQATEVLIDSLSDVDTLVRHVAAIELLQAAPDSVPEAAIRQLAQTVEASYADVSGYASSPLVTAYCEVAGGEDLQQAIVLALAHLQSGQADFLIQPLIDYFDSDEQFYEFAHALLALAFPPSSVPLRPSSLSDTQRHVLRALAANAPIWNGDGDLRQDLAARGLPSSRVDVKALVGDAGINDA